MATYYSVVQYVPDAVLGERVNIGVVVFGAGRTLTHFLGNWQRVREFATADVVAELREFGRQAKRMTEATIRAAAERWHHSVRLTPPAGSLLPDDALLYDAASRFLVDPPRIGAAGYKVKSDVAKLARTRVRGALIDRLGASGGILLKDDYAVPGHYGTHPFDLAVANGRPYYAAEAVSFENPDPKRIDRNIGAAAFAIQDVRRGSAYATLPLAVVVAPPKGGDVDRYEGALAAFRENGAEVVRLDQLDAWAGQVADLVAAG